MEAKTYEKWIINGRTEVCKEDGYPIKKRDYYREWVNSIEDIKVTEIGEANNIQKRGLILTSFNAG